MRKKTQLRNTRTVLDRLQARKRRTRRRFIGVFLLFLLCAAVFTYAKDLYPWNVLQKVHLKNITFEVNGDRKVVVPDGGTLTLGTEDSVRLVSVDTTSPFELGIGLWSDIFSVDAIKKGLSVQDALVQPEWVFQKPREIRVDYHRRSIGGIKVEVKPTTLFWIKHAAETKDIGKKIALVERAEKLNPDSVLLKIQLAKLYEQTGKLKEATRYYETVTKMDSRPQWLDNLVSLYRKTGNKEELDRVLAQRAKAVPSGKNFLEAAKFAEDVKDWPRAAQYYEDYAKVAPKPEKARVLKRAGYCYVSDKKTDKAIRAYEEALDLDPKDINLYYNLAELYRMENKPAKYASYLEKALLVNNGDKKTRIRLINYYGETGQYKLETDHLKALLAEDPKNASLHEQLVQIYEKTGQNDLLLDEYEKLVGLEPGNKVALFNIGVLQFKAKKYEAAENAFRKVVQLDAKDEEAQYYLLDIYRKTGKQAKAIEQAKTMIALNPDNLELYDYLFTELGETDKKDELIPILLTGVKVNPNANRLREYLGLIYLEKNDVKAAITQLEKANALANKNVRVLYNLAKLYEAVPDVSQALKYYKMVLSIDDSYKDSKESYLRLSMKRVREGTKQ